MEQTFVELQREALLGKLQLYTADWPMRADPPAHLPIKQRDAVPYIRRALEKIEEGTYGQCDDCGEAIPEGRLRAVPGAIRCVTCQREREEQE